MDRSIILPLWLDDIVYNKMNGFYEPRPNEVVYGPEQEFEHAFMYLGTYFPRSYAEAYCVMKYLFQETTYASVISNLTEYSIFDFCCGTGGELIGTIVAVQECLPNIQHIHIDAYDANEPAVAILNRIHKEYLQGNDNLRVKVTMNLSNLFVENKEMLDDIVAMSNRQYQLLLSSKALNEFVQNNAFSDDNAYHLFAAKFSTLIAPNGLMFLTDVSNKNENRNVWYPRLLNKGLNDFVRQNAGYKTILPHACYHYERNCSSCYMQDIISVSHSKYQNDRSKICYRIIAQAQLADSINRNISCPMCSATAQIAEKNAPYSDL